MNSKALAIYSSEPFYIKAFHIMEVVTKGNALRKDPKQCELITRKPSRNCTTAVRTNLGSLINHDSNGNAK